MKSVADSIHFLIYLVIYRLLQMEDLLLRTHPSICSRGWFPLCHTSLHLCCLWCCAAWSTQRRTAARVGSNSELNSPVFPMAHVGFPRGSSSIRIPKKQKGVVRHLVDPIRCWNFPSSQWGWQRRLLLFPETNSNQPLKTDKYKLMAPIGVWLIMELFWFILKKKTCFFHSVLYEILAIVGIGNS